jgi:hypothetical protein
MKSLTLLDALLVDTEKGKPSQDGGVCRFNQPGFSIYCADDV